MQAILKFNLPEENEEFYYANNGMNYFCVLWDLDQKLREKVKYNCDSYTEDQLKAYEEVRELISELLNDEGLKFY